MRTRARADSVRVSSSPPHPEPQLALRANYLVEKADPLHRSMHAVPHRSVLDNRLRHFELCGPSLPVLSLLDDGGDRERLARATLQWLVGMTGRSACLLSYPQARRQLGLRQAGHLAETHQERAQLLRDFDEVIHGERRENRRFFL